VSRPVGLLLVALLTVLAGCGGTGGVATTGPEPSTTASPTTTDTPATTTTEPCTASGPEYDVEVPDKPSSLTEGTAETLVSDFERTHRRAWLSAEFGDVSIDQLTLRESSREIDGGYEVNVTVRVAFTADGNNADGTFDVTYRVTEQRLVREGRTVACWDS
jgi:hypothetical protein